MKSGNVYVGTEGGEVEIRCPYPDKHIYKPKYFCREPCRNVLIKAEKTDQVFTTGRYSLYDWVNGRFFTVTIRKLKLTDSGVYYCGLDQWFSDTLKKVHLSVSPAPVNRPSHTTENTLITSNAHTTTLTSAESIQDLRDNSHTYKLLSTTVQSSDFTPLINSSAVVAVICAGVLSLLGCWILVALVILNNRRLNSTSKLFVCKVADICFQGEEFYFDTRSGESTTVNGALPQMARGAAKEQM
ncbi:CMRF35-like molecule 5 [Danio aesculapii]|uniref:CMRF35-like molecule 5 n=1 Tax=Danio aesculapii TaxID=1142201 RepID=UPI0024C014E8|nr:CMRF35-like molecule 5 [Danio aesculapii]